MSENGISTSKDYRDFPVFVLVGVHPPVENRDIKEALKEFGPTKVKIAYRVERCLKIAGIGAFPSEQDCLRAYKYCERIRIKGIDCDRRWASERDRGLFVKPKKKKKKVGKTILIPLSHSKSSLSNSTPPPPLTPLFNLPSSQSKPDDHSLVNNSSNTFVNNNNDNNFIPNNINTNNNNNLNNNNNAREIIEPKKLLPLDEFDQIISIPQLIDRKIAIISTVQSTSFTKCISNDVFPVEISISLFTLKTLPRESTYHKLISNIDIHSSYSLLFFTSFFIS